MSEGIPQRIDGEVDFRSCTETHEQLLRAGRRVVQVATLRSPGVSYGVGVPADAPYLRRAAESGAEVVRRNSGGTGLVHAAGDLLWAVVLPRSDHRVGRDFVHAYGRFGGGLVTLLEEFGVRGAWTAPPGISDDYCPLSARGCVLEVDGKVLSAAAQHVTRQALLHHGTLPLSVDRAQLSAWFDWSPSGPATRLTSLHDLGIRARGRDLAPRLAHHLTQYLDGLRPE